MAKDEATVHCVPSNDQRKVTITITQDSPISLQRLLKVLAMFLKEQFKAHGFRLDDVGLSKSESVSKES